MEVKRAFVLADWLKSAERCTTEEEFLRLIESERTRVGALSESELDQIVGVDPERLKRFSEFDWDERKVILRDCFVWDKMGGRPWATGTVESVASKFLRMESQGSRVWRMKLFARLFEAEIPLIVRQSQRGLEIEDGSHRAIAMYLVGVTEVIAIVGKSRS
jgi:hypothetical protein